MLQSFTNNSLPNLEALTLDYCDLSYFPATNKLPNLQTLSLEGNSLAELPDLSDKLETLILRSNDFKAINDKNWKSLKTLYIDENHGLGEFSNNQLPSLVELTAQSCNLTTFPSSSSMPRIVSLLLSGNKLSSFSCVGIDTL